MSSKIHELSIHFCVIITVLIQSEQYPDSNKYFQLVLFDLSFLIKLAG